MNKTVTILLVLLAMLIYHSNSCYACWDDWDDDWYYYDYDDSYACCIELDEVICTGSSNNNDDWYSYDDWCYYNYNDSYAWFIELDEVICTGSSNNNKDDWEDDTRDYEDECDDNNNDWYDDYHQGISTESTRNVTDNKTEQQQSLSYLLDSMSKANPTIGDRIDKLKAEGRIKECYMYNGEKLNNPKYDAGTHTLYLPQNPNEYSDTDILHELIHEVQDELRILNYDKSSSNAEFQAYLLDWLYCAIVYENGYAVYPPIGMSDAERDEMINHMTDHSGKDNDGSFWYDDEMISYIKSLDIQDMQNRFCKEAEDRDYPIGYYKHNDPNFEWKWEEILSSLGINKKNK